MDRNRRKKEFYGFRVKGQLASIQLDTFDGILITLTPDDEKTFRGAGADQAAHQGLLARIRDLNRFLFP